MVKISDIVEKVKKLRVEGTIIEKKKEEMSEEKRIKAMYKEVMKKYCDGNIYEAGMIADSILNIVKAIDVKVEGINLSLVEKLAKEFRKSKKM